MAKKLTNHQKALNIMQAIPKSECDRAIENYIDILYNQVQHKGSLYKAIEFWDANKNTLGK